MKPIKYLHQFNIFIIFLIILVPYTTIAQSFGNEWIDYSKTYIKFKVTTDGIYRIPKSTLDASGVNPATKGSDFVMYRNGKEVPLYLTTNVALTGTDYIEFYGTINDGEKDKELYLGDRKYNNPYRSLFSDTATYFLTIDASTTHLHYNEISKVIPTSPSIPPFAYCKAIIHKDNYVNTFQGKSLGLSPSAPLYSSQFENGEGYLDYYSWSHNIVNIPINLPNLISFSYPIKVKTASIATSTDKPHNLKLKWGSTIIADSSYGINDVVHFNVNVPPSAVTSSSVNLTFEHYATGANDFFGIPYYDIEYPRNWDFSGFDYFQFKLNADAIERYVEILNFNHGGIAPKLYDISNNKWYRGDISIAGKTRFLIDPSAIEQTYVLYSNTTSKIVNLNSSGQIKFKDYTTNNPSMPDGTQGNYIIITNKNLRQPYLGNDQVSEYKNYRSSITGGSYSVVIADIDELYDQFAYGTYYHPLAITHFVDYALNNWATKPISVFLIGKGINYVEYKGLLGSPVASTFQGLVPTYGYPGSDNAFVTDKTTWQQKTRIGRLSAWNNSEIYNYLNKVKLYEGVLKPASFSRPETESWKKQVLHLVGGDGSTPGLQESTLLPGMNDAKKVIESPFTGSVVHTYAKSTKGLPTLLEDKKVDSLVNTGISNITFYGHAAANTLDFNIKDPSAYTPAPHFPVLNVFGCDISSIFRLNINKTITEDYVKSPSSGAIASLGSNNEGYTNIHSEFLKTYYYQIAVNRYGNVIGEQVKEAEDSLLRHYPKSPNQTSFPQLHMESLILQGDPEIKGHNFYQPNPDYYVGADAIIINPVALSTSLDSFKVNINVYNLGKAINDSVNVKLEHINPAGIITTTKTYAAKKIIGVDSNNIWIPLDKIKDVGLNKLRVSVDYDARYDEISEANNTTTIDIFVLSEKVVPIYPYDFSIVHNNNLILKASTLNPFAPLKKYRIEIDTTELFNSSFKKSTTIDSKGGVINWEPGILLIDSTVYYWRCATDSLVAGSYDWSNSSFVYLKNGSDGWNQSHYFQYKYNAFDSLEYKTDRKFRYGQGFAKIINSNYIMELPGADYSNDGSFNNVVWNGASIHRNGCYPAGAIHIYVFDSSNGKPWTNSPVGVPGKYNSVTPCYASATTGFEYPMNTDVGRNNARLFLESIPNGNYILIRNHLNNVYWGGQYASTWLNDTLIYGSGKSIYYTLKNLGFNTIDSFNKRRLFSYFFKKGSSSFASSQDWTDALNEKMVKTYTFPIVDTQGKMNSVVVGPSSKWKTLKWRTSSFFDTASSADSCILVIKGISSTGVETILYSSTTRDTNLNFIDASLYPKLKLQWHSIDNKNHTSAQLDYWRILYDPLPEAALDPNKHYVFTDSVEVGQMMRFETAIQSLTELPMDSMLVRYKIIDEKGVQHLLSDTKYKKLNGNDSIHINVQFDPKPYPGKNYLFIEANPDNNQPEQYHPNNLGYLPFEIKTDKYAPVMDVTFDGIHILDKDIISSKPFIKIQVRDENKFLALNDTSKIKVYLKYINDPSSVKELIPFDGLKCKFVPANLSSGKNEAFIEYKPTFEKDGIYQLFVKSEDISGNASGLGNEYSISFEVINKSTITNLLNYPNPFSTATAFVFTLTGSQIPSQFKIQILTVTGKVVREITKQELGPLHIGRNLTTYKWDGKDQYGQLLGNGVYLYRVVTSINGQDVERRENAKIDKFNKNGYTKMYIMR